MDIKQDIEKLIKSEYSQYKLNESRDDDFGKLSEKIGRMLADAANKIEFKDYLETVKLVKNNFPHIEPLRIAKQILSESAVDYGDKNSNKIRALDDAEKEIIIKYHETPSHGGDGVYVGKNTELAKKVRFSNGKGLVEKQQKKLADGQARAFYIANSQKTAE